MKFLKRLLGICETRPPAADDSWLYEGGEIRVDLKRMTELSDAGGAVRLEGRGLPGRVLLLHGSDRQFHALENKCSHMGRRLDPLAGRNAVECCSVSKSTYSYDGDPVSGPASKVLRSYRVKVEADTLTVELD